MIDLKKFLKPFQFQEDARIVGEAIVKVYQGDVQTRENLLDEIEIKNLIVTTGRNLAARRWGGDTSSTYASIGYCALGIGTTAANAADTGLGTEVYRKPVSSVSYPGTGQVLLDTVFTTLEANNYSITELGWFNASAAGTMGNRLVLTGGDIIAKTTDRSLDVAWTGTFT